MISEAGQNLLLGFFYIEAKADLSSFNGENSISPDSKYVINGSKCDN